MTLGDLIQFWVQIRASTVEGFKELRNESRTRPPVLKADSEDTVDTGINNISQAMRERT